MVHLKREYSSIFFMRFLLKNILVNSSILDNFHPASNLPFFREDYSEDVQPYSTWRIPEDLQFGFLAQAWYCQPFSNMDTALVILVDVLCKRQDRYGVTILVFLNISVPFDKPNLVSFWGSYKV